MVLAMQAALRPRYTFAEYAMAGGTVEHSALATAFAGLLFNGSP
jgi:hypothetical protein